MVLPIDTPNTWPLPNPAPTQVQNNVVPVGSNPAVPPMPVADPYSTDMNMRDIAMIDPVQAMQQQQLQQQPQQQPKWPTGGKWAKGEQQLPPPPQMNVDGALSQLYAGNSQNIPAETLQLAQNRKTKLDLFSTKPASVIVDMVYSGTVLPWDKLFSDIRTYNPELFAQVTEEVKKRKDLKNINEMGNNVYNKITKGKLPTGLVTQQGEPVTDPMTQINDDMVNTVKSTFGANADAMMPVAQQMLGGDPLMQAQQSRYANAVERRKQLERNLANTESDVRWMLGSEVPESFASAYIARQTKDLTRQLQVYKDIEETEMAQINAQKEDMKMRLASIQFVPASKYNKAGYFDKMTGTFTPLTGMWGWWGWWGWWGGGVHTITWLEWVPKENQGLVNLLIQYKDILDNTSALSLALSPNTKAVADNLVSQITAEYKQAKKLGTLDAWVQKLIDWLLGKWWWWKDLTRYSNEAQWEAVKSFMSSLWYKASETETTTQIDGNDPLWLWI